MVFVNFLSSQVFANPEDAATDPKGKINLGDADVERVRRAHLNDLENIFPFIFVAHFYLMTEPSVYLATNLIRAFAGCRFAHTFFYIFGVRRE
jgi:glutathione S-transferase